ncbi:hypothetical protein BKA67DRAFT_665107 [Truncatella angustata]|uniref:RRM domain-containing protein n=1 Tax=Truncatella angustata TaxID=152316 RepID=A0A9P8REU1_9PEZI|nr:uncharacterized protein BKA67DRAFT_665107 [Truncatella angustata]KAH6643287.1 hypothetical protein BKA67DRAFT_665107 [Truncatella angustata]
MDRIFHHENSGASREITTDYFDDIYDTTPTTATRPHTSNADITALPLLSEPAFNTTTTAIVNDPYGIYNGSPRLNAAHSFEEDGSCDEVTITDLLPASLLFAMDESVQSNIDPNGTRNVANMTEHYNLVAQQIFDDNRVNQTLALVPNMGIATTENHETEDRRSRRDANYHGSRNRWRARDRATSRRSNTARFITNMPPDVRFDEIFDAIPMVGQVNFVTVMLPRLDHRRGLMRPKSAATLAFFTAEAARSFDNHVGLHGFTVRGQDTLVRIDENGSAPLPEDLGTRVLVMEGAANFAHPIFIQQYMRLSYIYYDVDREIRTPLEDGRVRLELRLAAWRRQAQSIYKVILAELSDVLDIRYGPDPCSPSDTAADDMPSGDGGHTHGSTSPD